MQIFIDSIHMRNFLLYECLDIDMQNQGKVFMSGQSPTNTEASNGKGKTTALSAFPWVAWEKLLRDQRKDVAGVIKYGAKECQGRVYGRLGDVPFWIERVRSENGIRLTASFSASSREKDVQADINRIFGTFELAQNTILLGQKKALEFLSSGDTSRRRLMEELLRIDVWKNGLKRISEDISEFTEKRKTLQSEKDIAERDLEVIRTAIAHSYDVALAEVRSKSTVLSLQRQEELALHAQQTTACAECATIRDEMKATLSAFEKKQDSAQKTFSTKNKYLHEAKKIRDELARRLVAGYGGKCPTCQQDVVGLPENEILDLQTELTAMDLDIANTTTETNAAEAALAKAVKERSNMCVSHAQAVSNYNHAQNTTNATQHRCDTLKRSIASLKREEEAILKEMENNDDHAEEISELETRISNRQEIISELDTALTALEVCKKGFGTKGVPAIRIAESLPLLVTEINKILAVLSEESPLILDILAADVAKDDGRLLERLTFVVWDDGREIYLEDCSEGQRRRIIIALFLAATRIQRVLTGHWWSFRAMDELFDSLDQPGIEAVMCVLQDMKDVPTILVTSHNSALKALDGFDQHWRCERGPKGSRMMFTKWDDPQIK